jgi:hypothetical protein
MQAPYVIQSMLEEKTSQLVTSLPSWYVRISDDSDNDDDTIMIIIVIIKMIIFKIDIIIYVFNQVK